MQAEDADLVTADDGAQALALLLARGGPVRRLAIGMGEEDIFSFEHARFYRSGPPPGEPLSLAPILAAAPELTVLGARAHAIDAAGAHHPGIATLTLLSAGWPRLGGARFPRLDRLELSVSTGGDAGDAATVLAGEYAPALTELRLGGDAVAPLVLELAHAPLLERLERLTLATTIEPETARRLSDDPGLFARLPSLELLTDGGGIPIGGAAPWLASLERARPGRAEPYLEAARALTRCRAWFLGPRLAGVRIWEWLQSDEGPGVAALAVMPRAAGGPRSAEEAFFPLVAAWRRLASHGWIDRTRAPGAEVPLEEQHWEALLRMIPGDNPLDPDQRGSAMPELAPGAFDRELAHVVSLMREAPALRILEDDGRAVPEPRAFTPPVGPAVRAVAVCDKWNTKLYSAETADAFLFFVWWTNA